jgi:hypothetical protein
VWIAGERLVADAMLTRLDGKELASRARFWQDRLQ